MYKKTWTKCECQKKEKKEDNFHRLQDLWDPILSMIAFWDQKWITVNSFNFVGTNFRGLGKKGILWDN
jgi:hypothetical protein